MSSVALDPARLAVIWHDVECASYTADLPAWERLADDAGGAVLDLGCGSGRVALHLARRGHAVTGVDISPELAAELTRRAAAEEVPAQALAGDATALDLGLRFALVIAPMQLLQVIGGARERVRCLRSAARHLAPGGRVAAAIVPGIEQSRPGAAEPLPDVLEVDGWVFSSRPVSVRATGDGFLVGRLRQTVSPGGDLSEALDEVRLYRLSVEQLSAEVAEAGLALADEIEIPPSEDHIGSLVAVLEAG